MNTDNITNCTINITNNIINNNITKKAQNKKVDYKNGVIYKISDVVNDKLLYVGSSVDFKKRKAVHKSDLKNNKNNKNLQNYFNEILNKNFDLLKFDIIEYYPCDNKTELCKRENSYIQLYKNELFNINKAIIIDIKQYFKDYKKADKYKQQQKEYRSTDEYKKSRQTDEYKKYQKKYQKEYQKEYYIQHKK